MKGRTETGRKSEKERWKRKKDKIGKGKKDGGYELERELTRRRR